MLQKEQYSQPSNLLDDALRQQLQTVFAKFQSDIVLKAVIEPESEKGMELASFLQELTLLSSKIHLEVYATSEEHPWENYQETYLPVTRIYKEDVYSGLAYHGIPGGQEMNAFVLGMYNVSGPGQPLDFLKRRKIEKITDKVNLKICVSLACHHCPKMVNACQMIAANNPNVTAEMIDANLFPELVEKYHMERVPVTIINDQEIKVGPLELDDAIYMIQKAKK